MKSILKYGFLLCFLTPLWAENSTVFPPYTIHHNALTTDFLTPEIARQYQIKRSKNQAMINISVIKNQTPTNIGIPVVANVKVIAKNLIGQQFPILLNEIKEGNAIYYIGDFPVSHRALYRFNIEVQPEKKGHYLKTKMQQTFYTD